MKNYAGLDVSLKEVSICVVDEDGKVVARGVAPADPDGISGWLTNRSLTPERIVHESGQQSIRLQRGLAELGFPAICIDARKAHKTLSARLNKSDSADAEGLAQLARTGWFTPVHIRSQEADRLRSLVGARERLIRLRKDLEGHIRGVLKTFGIRMTGVGQGQNRQAFRDQLAATGESDPVLRIIADGFISAHSTLCMAASDLERALKAKAKSHSVARRLMTIPGVGPIVSLSFVALVGDPGGSNLGCRSIPWADAPAAPVRRDGLVGPSVQVWRCRHAWIAFRSCVLPDPAGETVLGTEIMGRASGRSSRLSKGRRCHRAQDRGANADGLEEWHRLSMDKGGHSLI